MSNTSTHFTQRIPFSKNEFKFMTVPQAGYQYATFINDTPATIVVYEGRHEQEAPENILLTVRPFYQRTIPVDSNIVRYLTLEFQVPLNEPNSVEVILSVENLGYNTNLGGDVSSDTTIVADNVGLAKQAQFPQNLSNGNLRVAVMNDIEIAPESETVPKTFDVNQHFIGSGQLVTLDESTNNKFRYYSITMPILNGTGEEEFYLTYGLDSVTNALIPIYQGQTIYVESNKMAIGNPNSSVAQVVIGKFYYE